jgi:hypothetical protein
MKLENPRLLLLTAVATVVLLGAAVGCGNGGAATESQTYDQVLGSLKRAALANATYGAVRRAKNLGAGERIAVDTFCDFARVVVTDFEEEKLAKPSYVIGRVTTYAEKKASFAALDPTRAAMAKLFAELNPASFDGRLIRRYEKACYQ